MNFYPLALKPAVKDYLWGGRRLITEFGYEGNDIAAEAWVLSCHKDGPSVIQNGPFAGKTLDDALKLWGDAAIGKNAAAFSYFPLLIKLIDARDRLSVQVHPSDEYALRVEGEFGKTEMWYVVDCAPAPACYEFNTELTRTSSAAVSRTEACPRSAIMFPSKGDVFFIEAAPCTR